MTKNMISAVIGGGVLVVFLLAALPATRCIMLGHKRLELASTGTFRPMEFKVDGRTAAIDFCERCHIVYVSRIEGKAIASFGGPPIRTFSFDLDDTYGGIGHSPARSRSADSTFSGNNFTLTWTASSTAGGGGGSPPNSPPPNSPPRE